ncbi:MAG TPA: 2-amino-4-hydroxy-6-hydroxymethyldihydropteridine diphosphokinase [Flavobacteriales bacterium]|nr:2-amino-4-hydroxy-6-hydroxymethyldihydropteridine diphosphokinase [Flavobacteriales bacterium]
MPTDVLLLLGGNVGDPPATLAKAEALIAERCGTILAHSRDHRTEPWGFVDEHLFLNRAVLLSSAMEPVALMKELLAIETELGRVRNSEQRYAARTIDIDILLIGDRVISEEALIVPHPRLHERAFALAPAADIVPGWIHPMLHRSVLQLLNDLRHPVVK